LSEHHFRWIDTIEPRQRGAFAWFSDHPSTDIAVVFVHGFLGDAEGTWLNFQGMVDTHTSEWEEWSKSDMFFFPYASFRKNITDSAADLVSFLRTMYPSPRPELFAIDRNLPLLPKPLADLDLKPRSYKHLILVGHSQGALIIRRALILIWQDEDGSPLQKSQLLAAKLALFAPAIFGFAPSGWVASVLRVGRVEKLAMLVLDRSPSFAEMKEKAVPRLIEDQTNAILPSFACFMARVLFGKKDKFVTAMEYVHDLSEPSEPKETHTSICKPRAKYLRPFKFVFRKTPYA
jgi:pimeloyl-ACP methyl ester carboxylesterase